jgi:DNA-binding transcriptional LysR family regulator
VELTLLELTATEQIEAFDRGQLDVGFSRPLPAEPSREFDQELVYTDYLHLVLAPAHSLARNLAAGGTITVKRLSGEKFVLLQRREAIELRLNWRRAPSSPTVEAFRELVQSEREAIRTLMEPRPSEKKQRQGRRP